MLLKIKNFLSKNRKTIFALAVFSFLFINNDIAFADNQDKFKDMKETAVAAVNFLSSAIAVLLAIATYLVTMFLTPEWTSGAFFGITGYLKDIWVLVSNIVYFIFAFVLIFIAFMNIVGAGGEKYQLKQALPRFIVGILIVPFSWFIVNFFISLSSILTMSALVLPFDTFKGYQNVMGTVEIPKSCTLNLKSDGGTKDGNSDPWFECSPEKESVIELMKNDQSSVGIFSIVGLYTYGLLSLDEFAKLGNEPLKAVKTIGDLVVKVVFDFLFIILYGILMIVLAFVLLVRGIWLWVYMMFSPLFGLMYFLDKKDGGGDSTFSKLSIKTFLSLAFVPVYSMLALSFGLLFIYIVGRGATMGSVGFDGITIEPGKDKTEETIVIGSDEKAKLTIKGLPSSPENMTGFLKSTGGDTMGIIGSFIMKVLGLVVMWLAIMAAFKSNKITEKVAEPFDSFGKQVGKIATDSPKYLPIFGGQSMSSLSKTASRVQGAFDTNASNRSNDFLRTSGLGELLGVDERIAKLNDIASKANKGLYTSKEEKVGAFREVIKMSKNNSELYTRDDFKKAIFELSKNMLGSTFNSLEIKSADSIDAEKYKSIVEAIEKDAKYEDLIRGETVIGGNVLSKTDEVRKGTDGGNSLDETQSNSGKTDFVYNNNFNINNVLTNGKLDTSVPKIKEYAEAIAGKEVNEINRDKNAKKIFEQFQEFLKGDSKYVDIKLIGDNLKINNISDKIN